MIATQGNGENPILKYVEQFIMEYSIDGTNWVNVTSDGTGIGPAQVITILFFSFAIDRGGP